MKLFDAKNETEKYARFVIFGIFIGKFLSSLIPNWADQAMRGCGDYFAHGYTVCPPLIAQTQGIPYGELWNILNPLGYGMPWQMYCVGFDFATWAIQWHIKQIPRRYLMFHQLFTLVAYMGAGHEYQNVTVLAIMPFMWLSKYVGAIPLLEKLPIAFDWRARVQCAIQCANPLNHQTTFTIPMVASFQIPYLPILLEPGHLSNYCCLGLCFILPWYYKRAVTKSLNTPAKP